MNITTLIPHRSLMTLVIIAILAALLLVACTSSEDGIEEGVLRLTFDGENCAYDGPEELKPGPVTILFQNESGGWASMYLMRPKGDETIQDFIDYRGGEEPSTKYAPSWTTSYVGVWKPVKSGENQIWEGVLEPGIHSLVCASRITFGVWQGTFLIVEE